MQYGEGHLPSLFLKPTVSSKNDAHAHADAMSTGVLGRWGKNDVDAWRLNKEIIPQDCTPQFLQKEYGKDNARYDSAVCWKDMLEQATEFIVTYEKYLSSIGKAEDECMAKTIIFVAPKEAALEYWFWHGLRTTLIHLYMKRVHKARTGEEPRFVVDDELHKKAQQILQHVVLIDPTVSKPTSENDLNYPQDVIDEWKKRAGYVIVFENMQPTDKLIPANSDSAPYPVKIMYLYGSDAYNKLTKAMQERQYPYAPLVVNLHQDFLTTVQSQTEYNPLAFFQAKLEQDKLANYSSLYLTVNSYPKNVSFMQDMVDIIEATIEKGAVQHVNKQEDADSSSSSDDSDSDDPRQSWMGRLFGVFDSKERGGQSVSKDNGSQSSDANDTAPEGAGALLSAGEANAEKDRLAKEDAERVEASNKFKDDVAILEARKEDEKLHYQSDVEMARRLQAEEQGRAGPSSSNNNDARFAEEPADAAAEAAQIEQAKSNSILTKNAQEKKEQSEKEAEGKKPASSSKQPHEAAAEAAMKREAAQKTTHKKSISQRASSANRKSQDKRPVSTKKDTDAIQEALDMHAKEQSLKTAKQEAAARAAEEEAAAIKATREQGGTAAEAAEEASAKAAAIMAVEEYERAEAAKAAAAAAAADSSGEETLDDIIEKMQQLTARLNSLPSNEDENETMDSIISEMKRLKNKIDDF